MQPRRFAEASRGPARPHRDSNRSPDRGVDHDHGTRSIADRAIPLTGQLGFSSWPPLWRHLSLATYDIDAFGLDPVIAEMAWHLLNMLYYDYFRVEVEGIENVPMEVLLEARDHGRRRVSFGPRNKKR